MKWIFCAFLALGLASCSSLRKIPTATAGAFKSAGSATASGFKSIGSATASSFKKVGDIEFASLIPGRSRVPIVKARPQDMQDLPSGQDRAVAFQKTRTSRFWFFGPDVDVPEPPPSVPDDQLDAVLLPPITE